jgi:uncharacterized protein YbjT (DUF2867 family)
MQAKRHVFVTGGTGYMGSRLIGELLGRGHRVRALVRKGSEKKVPAGTETVIGNALDANSYKSAVPPCDSFVQLVGVAHPSPAKAAEFRAIDLPSGKAGVAAASDARVAHFVYVSAAQPSNLMKAYIEARAEVEESLRGSGLKHTIIRPWYVLGPGHRWPYALIPVYKVMELIPSTRDSAKRLGLVTLQQMIAALVLAVENPSAEGRIVTVPEIRKSSLR